MKYGSPSQASQAAILLGVRVIAPVTEDEVIATFLRGEIDSPRFATNVHEAMSTAGVEESVLRTPDLTNAAENAARRRVLAYRGWPNQALFSGFPDDAAWSRVVLTRSELGQVRYLNFPEWVRRSDGSRLPEPTAERIRSQVVTDPVLRAACAAIAQRYSISSAVVPIVLVSAGGDSPLVVLEGCVRLTAVFFGARGGPDELKVLLGRSPRMREWAFY